MFDLLFPSSEDFKFKFFKKMGNISVFGDFLTWAFEKFYYQPVF